MNERPTRPDLSSESAPRSTSDPAARPAPQGPPDLMISDWGQAAAPSAVAGPEPVIMSRGTKRENGRAAHPARPNERKCRSFNSRLARAAGLADARPPLMISDSGRAAAPPAVVRPSPP